MSLPPFACQPSSFPIPNILLMKVLIAAIFLFLSGCTTVKVTTPDGHTYEYQNTVFQKKVGEFEYTRTPTTQSVRLKGVENQEHVIQAISELAKTLK